MELSGEGNVEEFDTTALLATPVNMVVLGTEKSCKHRFLATFVGQLALNPVDMYMKRLVGLDGTAFLVNLDTNICGCWGINDQSFRSGQGFIFVYNTASRASFEEFTVFRERIMRVKEVERRLPLMIVGYHKSDKLRQVATSEGKKLSEYFGCLFKEVRQDDAVGVEECVIDTLREVRAYESGYIAKKPLNADDQETNDVSGLTEFGIAVMGDIFVGKTCLVRKLISNSFHPRYVSTSEDNTQKYRLAVDNKKFILRLIDTPGLMALDSLTKEYLLPMQGFILVYSVTSRDSFTRLQEYRKVIYKHKTETKIPIVVVGNKSDDKFGRQVSQEEGRLVARQLGASFFELSSKNDSVEAPFAQCVRDLQGLYETNPIMSENMGELEKMGVLQQLQKKKWRSRTFTLRNGILSFANADGGAIKGSMAMTQGVTAEGGAHDPKIGYPFDILCGEEQWMLAAPTAEERAMWLASIRLNIVVKEVGDSLVNEVLKVMIWEVVSMSGVKYSKPSRDDATSSLFRSEELDLIRRPSLYEMDSAAVAINRSMDSLDAVESASAHKMYGRSVGAFSKTAPESQFHTGSMPTSQERWSFSLRRGLSSLRKKDDPNEGSPSRDGLDESKERKTLRKLERKEKKKEKEDKKKDKKARP